MSSTAVVEQRTRLLASVVGFRFHNCTPSVMESGFPIYLKLDPENEIDHSAVKVLVGDVHVGFIAKQDSPAVRRAIVDCEEYTVAVETVFNGSVRVRIEAVMTNAVSQSNKKRRVDTPEESVSGTDDKNARYRSMASDALVYKMETLVETLATLKGRYFDGAGGKHNLKSALEAKFKGAELEDTYEHIAACQASLDALLC